MNNDPQAPFETVKLPPDTPLRRRLFTPESLRHPAKGHLALWQLILERYTKPGDWVLDPMAGAGATMLGALMGRNIICVELEQHFIEPMKASWVKMQQSPMLGHELGQVVILRGDARCLSLGRADCDVTSPPFEDNLPNHLGGSTDFQQVGGIGHKQVGYTRPSAIITSPPYEASDITLPLDSNQQGRAVTGNLQRRYTRPVDAVVTSPPYTEAQSGGGIAVKGFPDDPGLAQRVYSSKNHNHSTENIGNLKGDRYWEAMRDVYSECHRVLRPAGLMILVLKGFTRDGKYVDLPSQTRQLCETLGFSFVETWQRELWALSFWRILQRKNHPETWDDRLKFETVLVLKKGKEQVNATSPC